MAGFAEHVEARAAVLALAGESVPVGRYLGWKALVDLVAWVGPCFVALVERGAEILAGAVLAALHLIVIVLWLQGWAIPA